MKIGQDKLMHMGVCFTLEIMLAFAGLWNPMLRVIFVAVGIGGAKEYYDSCHEGHDADWRDILADLVGALAGELAVLLLHG